MKLKEFSFLKDYAFVQESGSTEHGYFPKRIHFIFWAIIKTSGIRHRESIIQDWSAPLDNFDKRWKEFCKEMKKKDYIAVAPATNIPEAYKDYIKPYKND